MWKWMLLASSVLLILGCSMTGCEDMPELKEENAAITDTAVVSLDTFYLKLYPTHYLDDSGNVQNVNGNFSSVSQYEKITSLVYNNKLGDTLLLRFYVTSLDYVGGGIYSTNRSQYLVMDTMRDTVVIYRNGENWLDYGTETDNSLLAKTCACSPLEPWQNIDSIHIEYNPQKQITLLSIQNLNNP
jgi:hypothetical protein